MTAAFGQVGRRCTEILWQGNAGAKGDGVR
jgi:hypothetical protein